MDVSTSDNLADYFIPKTGRYIREDMYKIGTEGTSEDVRDYYNDIAEFYDVYCETTGRGIGAVNMAKIVQDVQPNKEARILDVACGNGILGVAIKKLGYTNVDGLDFAQKMVDLCKSKGIYNKAVCAAIEEDKKVKQLDEDTYDVACMNGGMLAGCLTPSHVSGIAKLVKPGGHVVFNITYHTGKNFTIFKEENVASTLQSFIERGILSKWSKGGMHTYYETTGEEAFVYVATVA